MSLKELLEKHRGIFVLNGKTIGVKRVSIPPLELFVGVERQKGLLLKNTKALLEGRPFNDALLWGRKGVGKSSLVRAMLNLSPSLRLVQVDKGDIPFLVELFQTAWDVEDLKLIVLIDDLSFEEPERELRILKTLLEGSVFERPPNVTIYATSNRKNLIPNPDEGKFKFPREEIEERFSTADRFGLKIGFTEFSKEDYLKAVENYLKLHCLKFNGEIKKEALAYASDRDFSGRTAFYFVKYWIALRD